MEPQSPVTEIHTQLHSCYLRFLSCIVQVLGYDEDAARFVVQLQAAAAAAAQQQAGGGGRVLAVPTEHLAPAFPWLPVPYAELLEIQDPANGVVDITKKERYLSPAEFKAVFEQKYKVSDLMAFYRMPRWKQRRAREAVGLGAT
jgi:hypothetical protein